jgi:hypothetical protein
MGGSQFQASPDKNVSKTLYQKEKRKRTSWVWWFAHVIPVMLEVEEGESQSKPDPG